MVLRLSALGDVAIALPLLYTVARSYPKTRFVLVTSPLAARLVQNAPANLEVCGVDVRKDYVGLKGLRRLSDELLSRYRPEVVVDLHDVLRTKVLRSLARLRGIKVSRIHKDRFGRYLLTRRRHKRLKPLTESLELYRSALGRFYPVTIVNHSVYDRHGEAPLETFEAITGRPRRAGEQWIGIAPFAAHHGKVYPTDQMRQVISRLSRADGSRTIYLFGGGDQEAAVLGCWADEFPGVVSLAGKRYGFAAELGLMNHLSVMLSMDSANMHLASLVRTPVVSVWGSTSPLCGFYGWGQNASDAIELPLECRPCSVFGNRDCLHGDYRCLSRITPEQIAERIESVLAGDDHALS